MNIFDYLERMKGIQQELLCFIESENEMEEQFFYLIDYLCQIQILNNSNEFKSFLNLLVKTYNNHYRGIDFFIKIEKILNYFKNDIIKYFSNYDIFSIFKSNKKILLYLLNEKILNLDKSMANLMFKKKYLLLNYPQYFLPEIMSFINDIPKKKTQEMSTDLPDNFEGNRKIGENSNYICQLIRKDMIDEFVIYINKTNISLNSKIIPSIFETNSFLLKNKQTTLIEYAAFHGSIRIFHYLLLQNVKLHLSLWIYGIHGNNAEIIHLLEDNKVKPINNSFEYCLKEAIKCHHSNIANYLIENLVTTQKDLTSTNLKYYYFALIKSTDINESYLFEMCQYGYYILLDFFLKNSNVDVNRVKILFIFF